MAKRSEGGMKRIKNEGGKSKSKSKSIGVGRCGMEGLGSNAGGYRRSGKRRSEKGRSWERDGRLGAYVEVENMYH